MTNPYREEQDYTEYNKVLSRLLLAVPEIREEYEAMQREYDAPPLLPADDFLKEMEAYFQEMQALNEMRGIDPSKVDVSIALDNMLMPFLVTLATNPQHTSRLAEVMAWVEELASSPDFHVRNLIAVTVCEAIITNDARHFAAVFPYMGEHTRGLCRMQLDEYIVSADIKRLLGSG